MSIVKFFLLKHTDLDPITINNITFAEATNESMKLKMNANLIRHLEVAWKAFEVLMDTDFPRIDSIPLRRVQWNATLVEEESPRIIRRISNLES